MHPIHRHGKLESRWRTLATSNQSSATMSGATEMKRRRTSRLGKQSPRYSFILNPYQDVRCTSCPKCGAKTRLRKFPLVIHVDPMSLLALNKTCRFCPACELLIAHQDEIEEQLAIQFSRINPEAIGNDYLVVGTLDRDDWRRGRDTPLTLQDMLDHLHDFKRVLKLEVSGGWMPASASPTKKRNR